MNFRTIIAALYLTSAISAAAFAQPTTPPTGSPAATITIPGDQLPPPPQKFGGKIERDAKDSRPYWPSRVVPPKGAPNVLLIITDDAGYGVPSTFGGVIPTPETGSVAPQVGTVGLNLVEKVKLRIDKREGCRKQADAQGLGMMERIKFVQTCVQQ